MSSDTIRRLIVTADDLGLSLAVNEAVEAAHRDGILTAASLMVGEDACQDAVRRARAMPELAVGLHVTLVDARPVLPASEVPDLVGPDGRFRTDLAAYGAAIFFRPAVRAQAAREIEAQFAAYAATGLPLDHVDSHRHFHLHPSVTALLFRIGPRFGMRALRVPVEPTGPLRAVEPGTRLRPEALLVAPFARQLRARARRRGLVTPDQVLGLSWSGAMTAARVARLLRALPGGLTELYLHPATADVFPGSASSYRYREELAALVAPEVRAARDRSGAISTAYGHLAVV